MRKKLVIFSMVAALILGAFALRRLWMPQGNSVRGELVETFCWTTGAETGPDHAACGIDCAKRGIPVALYDAGSGRSYVLLPARDKGVLPAQLIAAMGRQVTVQGDVINKGGSSYLTVKSFALVK